MGCRAWQGIPHPCSFLGDSDNRRTYNQHSSVELKTNSTVKSNITIMFDPEHSTAIEWTSSNPEVLSETGKYNPGETDQSVDMKVRLSAGDYYWEKAYTANCLAATEVTGDPYSGLVAYYNFDEKPVKNQMNSSQTATLSRSSQPTSAPTLETDYNRFGQVIHQYFGANGYNSYARMSNPLKDASDLDGFTVSLWVYRYDAENYYDDF